MKVSWREDCEVKERGREGEKRVMRKDLEMIARFLSFSDTWHLKMTSLFSKFFMYFIGCVHALVFGYKSTICLYSVFSLFIFGYKELYPNTKPSAALALGISLGTIRTQQYKIFV